MRPNAEVVQVLSLVAGGLNDCEIARRTGIPRRTIRDWRHGRGFIAQRLNPSEAPCGVDHDFRHLPAREYAYLLGMYLGDGCISASGRPNVWRLRIFMDGRYPAIIDECAVAMEAMLPGKHAHRLARNNGAWFEVSLYSKHWQCFFPQHGPGKKHHRRIELVDWQRQILSGARTWFVRGLIHSDGCRFVAHERKGNYTRDSLRYSFSNLSEDIKDLFCESCDALGIGWTRPSRREIAIYRKDSVALLETFVGPKS